ncbi:Ig domain-containing protein [Rhizobium etli]|nr:Ig domain-containing protein [Rhizobium etli]
MRLFPVTLAVFVLSSSAYAAEYIWRSRTTGTLKFVAPPPELEVHPAPVADFGISYGSTRVLSGTNLFISPLLLAGGLPTGYTFTSPDLPSMLSLDVSSGLIRGRISVAGRYEFSVVIADSTGRSQSVPIVIVVQ